MQNSKSLSYIINNFPDYTIESWDEAISALYSEPDTDIFITGSNSKLLSSELSKTKNSPSTRKPSTNT